MRNRFFLYLEKRPRWRRRGDSPKRALIIIHLVAVALRQESKGRKSNYIAGVTLLQQDGYCKSAERQFSASHAAHGTGVMYLVSDLSNAAL